MNLRKVSEGCHLLVGLRWHYQIFGGDKGVCPQLGDLEEDAAGTRYSKLIESKCRTGRELKDAWGSLVREATQALDYLGEERIPEMLQVGAEGAGMGKY